MLAINERCEGVNIYGKTRNYKGDIEYLRCDWATTRTVGHGKATTLGSKQSPSVKQKVSCGVEIGVKDEWWLVEEVMVWQMDVYSKRRRFVGDGENHHQMWMN
ncbi:hypothetical protein L3X38_017327 [Prunus dulcis]|uniref:Uncharacterized protein n=1 Tax=Prunus dulcis TaxID=3755 RepID=A0AAD4W9I4_PRUDU|nr:hypothetical protein L3X38_017327 [Prunus dulcis]